MHAGDFVRAGEALVDGPLVPHDILRISGEEAVQQYLVREIQNVYRSQRVEIDDKHIEIIVSQMLRKVRIESVGDTGLLPGSVMDKFEFRKVNQNLARLRRRSPKRATANSPPARSCPRTLWNRSTPRSKALGGEPAKGTKPKPATASTQLLGITKAAVQSSSFISAASFQETTKVLTEAALAGKVDNLVGLKENVILGHLIPAGTGFHTFQESEVRIRREALEALAAEKEQVLTRASRCWKPPTKATAPRRLPLPRHRPLPRQSRFPAQLQAAWTHCWAAMAKARRRRRIGIERSPL